jgi:hypothetical protein
MISNSQPFVVRTVVGLAGWQGAGPRHVYVVPVSWCTRRRGGTGVA